MLRLMWQFLHLSYHTTSLLLNVGVLGRRTEIDKTMAGQYVNVGIATT
jgi:hypothetical protein